MLSLSATYFSPLLKQTMQERQLVKRNPERLEQDSATPMGWDFFLLLRPGIIAATPKCVSCLFACAVAILFSECLCFTSHSVSCFGGSFSFLKTEPFPFLSHTRRAVFPVQKRQIIFIQGITEACHITLAPVFHAQH